MDTAFQALQWIITRRVNFEAIDLIAASVNNRFDQPGYKIFF